jgi:hypothetical protein
VQSGTLPRLQILKWISTSKTIISSDTDKFMKQKGFSPIYFNYLKLRRNFDCAEAWPISETKWKVLRMTKGKN